MRHVWAVLVACLVVGTAGRFAMAAAPVITSVDIDRTLRINAPGMVCYDQKITVRVTDADYWQDLSLVTITDSGDPPNSCTMAPSQGSVINATSMSFVWTERDLPVAPPPAAYTFSVCDLEGNADVLASDALPAMPGVHMSVVAPAMESVISQTAPTLQWYNANAATEKTTRIDVYEEALQNSLWYRSMTSTSTSVVFGVGGTARYGRTQLLANHSYVWTVRSGTNTAVYTRPADPGTTYHQIIARDWQELHGRFSVYGAWAQVPSPPSLPGKLTYSVESVAVLTTPENWGVTGILGYNTDPTTRLWLGPEAATDPDWSPDGTKLVYATPTGLYIDDFSGDAPVWVPGTTGADAKCRWAPDGNRILFGRCPTGDSYRVPRDYELWVTDQDGADAHPIVGSVNRDICLSPSPDGEWVAYESWDGYGPSAVRLVRYDGSDDHPVAATGVVGQDPAYVVTSLAQPAWSPDDVTLAVVFEAESPELPTLVGVGTIAASGGPVTPLFTSPYFYSYAAPLGPVWSPDGTQVAFSSGHHRPDLTGYNVIWAAELWVVNADGSSPSPVRLTEDYSLNRALSWSGMNTPAGSPVSFRRGDVTLVFDTVTVAGMSDIRRLGQPAVPPPPGMQYLAKSYEAFTTAQYTGSIAVEVRYVEADVPAGQSESALVLLHWENGQWVDVTVPPVDTEGNVIRGACTSLGTFALATSSAAPPAADFTAAPVSGQVPLTVYFTDNSSGDPTSWSWDFGDGATSADQSPSHTYTSAGTYDVSLTATNAAGSDSVTRSGYVVAVMPPPVAGFTGSPTQGTVPLVVSFTDQSTGAPTTWAWQFGDGGTSAEQNPNHTYATAGTYGVTLTASNDGGADTCVQANYIVVLPQPPVADFAASPTRGIAPLTVSLTDLSSGSPTAWSWSFGDGGVSSEQNPSHTYAAVGTYTVSLTASNVGGSGTCVKTGLVRVLPPPPVADFAASPTRGIVPLMVSFADLSTGVVASWAWDFGDGGTSTEQSPSHTYTAVGSFTVSLTVTNDGGASTSTKVGYISVAVPPPVAEFTATPTSGTVPLAVQFADASLGGPTAWLWSFGDGAVSAERDPSHVYTSVGTYSVSLTASNEGGADTCTKAGLVAVLPVPPPVASFTASAPTVGCAPLAVSFTDTSSGLVTSWLWDFGDGSTSTLQNPTHVYAGVGTYTVSLTVSNAGGSSTATAVGRVTTYQFIGPLDPINPDGSSSFRQRSTVQVRVQIVKAGGSDVTDADVRLFVAPADSSGNVVGEYSPAPGWKQADNAFAYDRPHGYWEFPLDGRALSAGTWSLKVTVSGVPVAAFGITLRGSNASATAMARRRGPGVSASPGRPTD